MTAANDTWVWLNVRMVLMAHEEQLAEHGGPAGLRDQGMLASALARPTNLALYENPDAAAIAASYAFGLARNHPFVDGNKRTAFVAMEVFLDLNGLELAASDGACVLAMLQLAAGEVEEAAFAQWVRENLQARSS